MQYKTTIEIINEAENSTEAADIAGEYLCGSIDTGVRMNCTTKPLRNYTAYRMIFLGLLITTFIGLTSLRINKNTSISAILPTKNVSAIQPPLKTHLSEKDLADILEEKNR